jgi:ferredoxin
VKDWMMQTEFKGNKDVYFVLTCGSDMGNAEKYLKRLCAELGLNYKGAAPVVMPENYIAMFDAPDEEESAVIIKKADRTLNRIARRIKNNENLLPVKAGIGAMIKSGINTIYYTLIVKDKKFYAEDTCNGCGLCAKKCPLGNIEMVDGKPQWNGNCTHCMACIAYCPTEAIEYGKISKGKRRYTCR